MTVASVVISCISANVFCSKRIFITSSRSHLAAHESGVRLHKVSGSDWQLVLKASLLHPYAPLAAHKSGALLYLVAG